MAFRDPFTCPALLSSTLPFHFDNRLVFPASKTYFVVFSIIYNILVVWIHLGISQPPLLTSHYHFSLDISPKIQRVRSLSAFKSLSFSQTVDHAVLVAIRPNERVLARSLNFVIKYTDLAWPCITFTITDNDSSLKATFTGNALVIMCLPSRTEEGHPLQHLPGYAY